MRKDQKLVAILCLVLGLVQAHAASAAGGFQTFDQGTWDLGRALVGVVSAADSAATAFYNPAGMVELESPQLVVAGMQVLGDLRFAKDAENTSPGDNGGQAASDALTMSGFFVQPISEDWAGGISFTVPFAGTLDYSATWAGRRIVTSIDLVSYSITPALAYRVNERFSLGAAIHINYATVDQKFSLGTGIPEGRVHAHDLDSWDVGAILSLLFEPWEGTRIGVSYFSELDHDLSGDIDITTPGSSSRLGLDADLVLPDAVLAGVRQRITHRLVVFADIGWANFSAFDTTEIELSFGVRLEIQRNWRDIRAYGLGVQYELSPEWTFQAGVSYASSPVHNKDRRPDTPVDRQVRYGLGVIYRLSKTLKLALSYEYVDVGDSEISLTLPNGDSLSGDYDSARVQLLAFTLSKSF